MPGSTPLARRRSASCATSLRTSGKLRVSALTPLKYDTWRSGRLPRAARISSIGAISALPRQRRLGGRPGPHRQEPLEVAGEDQVEVVAGKIGEQPRLAEQLG